MPAGKYRSIQNPRQYRALRRAGYSKEAAARISNAQAPGHRVKAAGYGARAGEVIAGNLARGNDGKFTAAGNASAAEGDAAEPKKPPARSSNAAARRERASQEADRRAEEDAAEEATRAEEDARLDAAKTPKQRAAIRREIAKARRERAAERRAARRERQAGERDTRTQEDAAAEGERQSRADERERKRTEREQKPKPKKGGGGGGGKGGADPAKEAAQQERQAEQERRRAEADARREQRDAERRARQDAADARRDAADQRREQATAARLEREARELTDLAQQAEGGAKLTNTQWQRLIVQGMAQRTATGGMLTDAGRRQARRPASPFSVFKDAAGQWRWIAVSSTAFRDRDREIVSTKALADDCAAADATGDYGPLRWWHCPGVDIGDCDYNAVSGRSLIEMGTFRDEALARAAAKAAPDLELSIGFRHLPDEPGPDGAYTFIRRFERSLVPRGRASNPFTAFAVTTKEAPMTPEKLKAALEKLGSSPEARALMETIIADAQTREKAAEAAGIAYKEAAVYTAPDGTPGIIVDGAWQALTPTAEKAPMPPAEMVEAGATELEDGMAEEDEGGDNLLSPAEIDAIASAVAAALMGQLDGIAAKMAAVDEELKGRGYQKMKEATESLPAALAALAATVKEIQATVAELAGLSPGKGYRPSEDNPDLEALIESALKADGGDADPSDPYASVMKFLRPAA